MTQAVSLTRIPLICLSGVVGGVREPFELVGVRDLRFAKGWGLPGLRGDADPLEADPPLRRTFRSPRLWFTMFEFLEQTKHCSTREYKRIVLYGGPLIRKNQWCLISRIIYYSGWSDYRIFAELGATRTPFSDHSGQGMFLSELIYVYDFRNCYATKL